MIFFWVHKVKHFLILNSSDSGGPLTVAATAGGRVLVGVVSYGAAAGCEKGFVSLILDVEFHILILSF